MERSDNPQDMTWLPLSIPENVCFVISSLEGESLNALLARKPEVVEVAGLSDDEVEALVEEFLREVRKEFPSPEARDAFLVKVKKKVPLYIMVALEELRVFGLFKELPQRIKELPLMSPLFFSRSWAGWRMTSSPFPVWSAMH
jgi:telomerase protein component 1